MLLLPLLPRLRTGDLEKDPLDLDIELDREDRESDLLRPGLLLNPPRGDTDLDLDRDIDRLPDRDRLHDLDSDRDLLLRRPRGEEEPERELENPREADPPDLDDPDLDEYSDEAADLESSLLRAMPKLASNRPSQVGPRNRSRSHTTAIQNQKQ
mmetsp:Transcript_24960/g.98598  ORF Transcript_24960/g.98598 Transcript_24960/m.98598 type:complete len:154 (+) Transcript_24960:3951-4412(+)